MGKVITKFGKVIAKVLVATGLPIVCCELFLLLHEANERNVVGWDMKFFVIASTRREIHSILKKKGSLSSCQMCGRIGSINGMLPEYHLRLGNKF